MVPDVHDSDGSLHRALRREPRSSALTALRLGVVVPARNEEAHIGECLTALDLAARVARHALDIVVVLDSCTDETAASVKATAATLTSAVHIRETSVRRVGTARRIGVTRLLKVLGTVDCWLATTDADSVVPPDWFVRQLSYRAAGAEMVVGTVHVDDWQDRMRLRPHYQDAYLAHHDRQADGHRHVHGANLSFSARAYLRSGGFSDVASDEDVRLVDSFRAEDERVAWASDLSVATSVRRVGRAPHGFAAYLNHLAHTLDAVVTAEPAFELST